jgi:hypothetical protein
LEKCPTKGLFYKQTHKEDCMKNAIKVLAIIALVAVIGFSMAACGDKKDPVGTGGGGGGADSINLYKQNFPDGYVLEFTGTIAGEDGVGSSDTQIKIDGVPITGLGSAKASGPINYSRVQLDTILIVGQSYAVEVVYTGSNSNIAAKFPISETLVCKTAYW